jgi:surface antigen
LNVEDASMRNRLPTIALPLLLLVAGAVLATASAAAKRHYYVGVSGIRWTQDFGVLSGQCNRAAISTRTVNRTLMGNEDRDNRGAAILIGSTIEDLVSGRLGYELDAGDRACLGEVMELGKTGHKVVWDNLGQDVHYEVTPEEAHIEISGACRRFKLVVIADSGRSKRRATACEKGAGLWQLSRL